MRVVVVELRATGMKLSREELLEAIRCPGELFVQAGTAYLCAGKHPGEWPMHGQVLPPLYNATVRRLKGNDLVIVGEYFRDCVRVHVPQQQAWWCQVVDQK